MKILIFLLIPLSLFSQTLDYPDTLYLKSGQVHSCIITQIDESNVMLKYGKGREVAVYLTGVEKLILDPIGIIYTDEHCFNLDLSQLKKIIKERYSSTMPAEIQVKSLLAVQSDSTQLYKRSAVLLQLWGPEVLGFHFNLNLTKRFSTNFGMGLFTGMHIGINYYLTDRTKSTSSLYIGSQIILISEFNPFGGSSDGQIGTYIQIGYEYMARNGFTFQIDVGPNIVKKDWGQFNTKPFIASLKIGYAFNSK